MIVLNLDELKSLVTKQMLSEILYRMNENSPAMGNGSDHNQRCVNIGDILIDAIEKHLKTLESEAEDLPDSKAHEASLINRGDY